MRREPPSPLGAEFSLAPKPPEDREKSLVVLEESTIGLRHPCGALDETTTTPLQ